MRSPNKLRWAWLIGLLLIIIVPACQSPSGNGTDEPFSYTTDSSIKPVQETIPGLTADDPRPLAAVADSDGVVSSFVANELLVMAGNKGELDAIVARYDAEIIQATDPADYNLAGLEPFYLLRIKVDKADLDGFADDIDNISGHKGGKASFSSQDAARLMAIAADEAQAGHSVGINWVGEGQAIPDATQEAPAGPSGYSPDAYQWNYMRLGTVIDIGVTEAWSLLHYADALSNRVAIAIIDGGFAPDSDFRSVASATMWPHLDPLGTENLGGCGGGVCPWHGTSVASAAMALPDNSYGSAGTGGPVGEPIMILTTYDFGTAARAVLEARSMGARIINMSFSADVNWVFAPLVLPFDAITAAVRDAGVLIFAAAGNDGINVDQKVSLGDWEKTWHTPCENSGVICVGGLENHTSEGRHDNSNYGSNDGRSVDIFAPYCVWTGPDPDHSANEAQRTCGTSLASPFTAGVAALVWSADPSLDADQVWNLMASNSRTFGSTNRVNAYDAVLQALDLGLSTEILEPSNGSVHDLNTAIGFRASFTLYAQPDGSVPVTIRWQSNRDGIMDEETRSIPLNNAEGVNTHFSTLAYSDLSDGQHSITLNVTAGALTRQDVLNLTVRNSAPSRVEITQPEDGSRFCVSETITFRGEAFDSNEPLGLPESAFSWHSDPDGTIGTGSSLASSTLSAGDHTIRLRVTDSGGLFADDAINMTILPASDPSCSDLSPTARIDAPADGTSLQTTGTDSTGPYAEVTFRATASDPEDDDSSLSVSWESSVEGSLGTRRVLTAKLHMTDEPCSQAHEVTLRVRDSGGNESIDTITVFVNQVCKPQGD